MGLTPERFLVVLKRVLSRRPELHGRLRLDERYSPMWTPLDHLVMWAIKAYHGEIV